MTDSVAASQAINDSVNPTLRLREALEGRIAGVEEEISLVEARYRQLQTRINAGQERRDVADAIRQHMLAGLSKYGTEEITNALDEHALAVAELAVFEQTFQDLADRRAEATERLVALRADLELVAEVIARAKPWRSRPKARPTFATRQGRSSR